MCKKKLRSLQIVANTLLHKVSQNFRDHSFSMYTELSEKVRFLTPGYRNEIYFQEVDEIELVN